MKSQNNSWFIKVRFYLLVLYSFKGQVGCEL